MSPIAIGMDILLAALLMGAMAMGWRLNGRLKALRASQVDFAKAVMELDAAAARADSGLVALKAAAEEAHDSLLARIDTARALALKLEKAEQACEGAARRAEAAAAEIKAAAPTPQARDTVREAIRPLTPLREAFAPRADGSTSTGHPAPRPAPRRRPIADEALFSDAEDDVRPSLKGLMRMSLGSRR